MNWSQPVDQYCERLSAGLWAEPLNFLSNLAFFAAAWFAFKDARRRFQGPLPLPLWGALALIVVVGIGSSLFHSFALFWTMLADVIPISIFLIFYVGVYGRHSWSLSWRGVGGGILGFLVLTGFFALAIPKEAVNGSQNYFGAAVTLICMAGLEQKRGAAAVSRLFGLACGVFILSITCRSVDLAVCPHWPWGTHVFWHLGNGVTIYLAMRALNRSWGGRVQDLQQRAKA